MVWSRGSLLRQHVISASNIHLKIVQSGITLAFKFKVLSSSPIYHMFLSTSVLRRNVVILLTTLSCVEVVIFLPLHAGGSMMHEFALYIAVESLIAIDDMSRGCKYARRLQMYIYAKKWMVEGVVSATCSLMRI